MYGSLLSRRRATVLLVGLAVALAGPLVEAQSGRGAIRGYVEFDGVGRNNVKAQGVVARVEMIPRSDGLELPPFVTNTDDVGAYMLDELPAGDYVLRISAAGFRTYETGLYLPSDFECKIATHLRKE